MAELKTKKNNASVAAFISSIQDKEKRADCKTLLGIFSKATGEKPSMWGTSIIGFGSYHYKSERSSQEGDWPLTGFSPRKQTISIYIMPGFAKYAALLKKLGKHKISGGSCLYIKNLKDVSTPTLSTLISSSVSEMRKRHPAP